MDANDENAIADAHVQKPLVGRKTLAITQSLTDEVHKWTRGMFDVNGIVNAIKEDAKNQGGEKDYKVDIGVWREKLRVESWELRAAADADSCVEMR